PLDMLSPWIDMVTRARTEVFADLAAQTHRRFIKSHTPLDGIPNDPAVTYICVGRDPRDAGLSMARHIDNTDIGAVLNQREPAAAIETRAPARGQWPELDTVRQPLRVDAPRADRLRSPSGGIPALPKADRQRRRPPITADPRSGPTSEVCAST